MEQRKSYDVGLLVLRVGLGVSFVLNHGLPKMLGGPEAWSKIGGAMGVYCIGFAPVFWGFLAAFAEAVGGLCLILGLLTRPFAVMLAFTMLTAMNMHLGMGESAKALWPLEVGIAFLALAVTGPGRYSVKHAVSAFRAKWYM
jgi:putative oxidoreductase